MGNKKVLTFLNLITTLSFLLLGACVPTSPSGKRKKENALTDTTPSRESVNSPEFSDDTTYFQNSSQKTTSIFSLASNYNDIFFLRGSSIHNYITKVDSTHSLCLVFTFSSASVENFFIATATPKNFYNFSSNAREYYYQVSPNATVSNQNFCQKIGLLNKLSLEKPTYGQTFSMADICPTCSSSLLISSQVRLLETSGNETSLVNTSGLGLKVLNSITPINDGPLFCNNDQQCSSRGLECCFENNCIVDKTLRAGFDASSPTPGSDFENALKDISIDPKNVYKYKQFYLLCPKNIIEDPITVTPDPVEEEKKRFSKLQELFECTSSVDGEMGFCTKTYLDANETGGNFPTGTSDLNFNFIAPALFTTSIDRIIYGNDVFVENGLAVAGKTGINIGAGNDNFSDVTNISFDGGFTTSTVKDELKIRYRVDSSCLELNTSLGKCKKYYVQEQNLGKVTDHFLGGDLFKLPYYASTNRPITVTVDGIKRNQGIDWTLNSTNDPSVEFINTNAKVFRNQEVILTFFVDLNAHKVNTDYQLALEEIKSICQCPDLSCRLKEVKGLVNSVETVTNYRCDHPFDQSVPLPEQQVVYLNTMTAPVRFFDQTGAPHFEMSINLPDQEAEHFEYEKGDPLLPNNKDNYIGFNEIYGTITNSFLTTKMAQMIPVEKNIIYDIVVYQNSPGTFNNCFNCGNDYHSAIAKLFPSNFIFMGGGYSPDLATTDPSASREYRSDDLLFGRACFLPATMIPWTHSTALFTDTQRKRRMAAQHFLFANGYQRDWYGFDYGSIIGSFDGVTWFAVGNQRRIKSQGNRLFLAINSYHTELTLDSSYQILVSHASVAAFSGSIIKTDFESDGAQCQQVHSCSKDVECQAKLGYDYVCTNVRSITTRWPVFDSTGYESSNISTDKNLSFLSENFSGPQRRCVYRGRGAPCDPDNYLNVDSASSYAGVTDPKLYGCSANNYCQPIINQVTGQLEEKFNDRISKYARSVKFQNQSSKVPESDLATFGMSSRVIGRPLNYIGEEAVPSDVVGVLSDNNIRGICLPGRDPSNAQLESTLLAAPDANSLGAKVLGIGITPTSLSAVQENYLSSCSVTNAAGNYIQYDSSFTGVQLSDQTIKNLAGTFNIPTNSLQIFEAQPFNLSLTQSFESTTVTGKIYEQNRCMKAPGSTCFSNFECAPNEFIASKVKTLSLSSFETFLNDYEIKFWQEELVCGQNVATTDPDYDLTLNRCCRETDKKLSIATSLYTDDTVASLDNKVDTSKVPGIEIKLDDPTRYSRTSTAYHKTQTATGFPVMSACQKEGVCTEAVRNVSGQFKTLNEIAGKTCCSGYWVRSFHKTNGGGHDFGPSKFQSYNKNTFQCMNWLDASRSCSNSLADPSCSARSTSLSEAERVFSWFENLELMGIPQVKILGPTTQPDLICKDGTTDNMVQNIIDLTITTEYDEASTINDAFSGLNEKILKSGGNLKMVYSEDEFNCCLPLGTKVTSSADATQCCSGFVNAANNQCALRNYSNLKVYFNRYVSNEAKDLPDSMFNDKTGFIKDKSLLISLACQVEACASGVLAFGVGLSTLKIKGLEAIDDDDNLTTRYIDGNDNSNDFSGMASLFDDGLKYNSSVYCLPAEVAEASQDSNDITPHHCGN